MACLLKQTSHCPLVVPLGYKRERNIQLRTIYIAKGSGQTIYCYCPKIKQTVDQVKLRKRDQKEIDASFFLSK